MSDPTTTICGALAADPELRYAPQGRAVANMRVAHTPRVKQGDQWVDGETLWMPVTLWGQPAEHAAECLRKGDRVIVTGRLKSRSFETREGEKRTVIELDADEVGASIKFATVTVTKTGRAGQQSKPGRQQSKPADDPWGTAAVPDDSEAPF